MFSEIRIILMMMAVLALMAWAAGKSWAGEGVHGERHLNPPPQLQNALVRAALAGD